MDRRNHLMLPFLVSVALAGGLIGRLFRDADPAYALAALMVSVLLVHIVFFQRSRD